MTNGGRSVLTVSSVPPRLRRCVVLAAKAAGQSVSEYLTEAAIAWTALDSAGRRRLLLEATQRHVAAELDGAVLPNQLTLPGVGV